MTTDRSPTQTRAAWYVGIDCGGTFTDLVMANAQREVHVFKAPSVPADPAAGVLDALNLAAEALDTSVESILEDCALLVHGSTVATNTVLEGKGARVGLVTTQGFRDSLHIRRGYRENAFDHRTPFPPALVPRYLRIGVRGRLDRDPEGVLADVRDGVVSERAAQDVYGIVIGASAIDRAATDSHRARLRRARDRASAEA